MPALQEYKCPNCGGAISFDSQTQKLKCPYCDSELEVEALEAYDKVLQQEQGDDLQWETPSENPWQEGEEENLRTYICASCGGQIVGDATLAATACPYCDNPVVIMQQFAGDLKPDYVIPFKLDKEQAVQALKQHYKGKRLLPKTFKDENHIRQIKGIYVPFWLFDADVDADFRFKGTRSFTWSDSRYVYTRTSHYAILRGGKLSFDRVPVDGSTKMDDDLMESLEPYDFSQAVDFQTAYLAGYLADRYDVLAEESTQRANARIRQSTEDSFRDTVTGYLTVLPQSSSVRMKNGRSKYALYPVWLLHTKWKDTSYTFAMNGQTGKMAGNLPMDKGLYWKWFWGLTGAVTAAAAAISSIGWLL